MPLVRAQGHHLSPDGRTRKEALRMTSEAKRRGAPKDGAGRYASVNGVELYHEIHGAGDPLVLLHGAFGTIESCFATLLPALAATREVIAVELQGHGHTADIDRPLSYEQMAEDVRALLDALGTDAVDLVGYSLGGAVALQLALRHPERVSHVVYAGGTSYRRDGLHPEMLEDTGSAADDLEGSVWHEAFLRVAPDPDAWPTLVAKVAELDRTFEGWSQGDIRGLQPPALLVIGDSDIVRPEHTVEMFRLLGGGVIGELAGLPRSQLAVLPGTSHVGVLDRVDWLRSMILEFLDPRRPQPL
jgi:pimeloyl-ACP methyl ester carboxylesterase